MLLKIKILFMDLTNVTKFLNPYFSDYNNYGHCFSLLIDYSHWQMIKHLGTIIFKVLNFNLVFWA